jgi:hypothetical protein
VCVCVYVLLRKIAALRRLPGDYESGTGTVEFQQLDDAVASIYDARRDQYQHETDSTPWALSMHDAIARVAHDVSSLWRATEPAAALIALKEAASWRAHPQLHPRKSTTAAVMDAEEGGGYTDATVTAGAASSVEEAVSDGKTAAPISPPQRQRRHSSFASISEDNAVDVAIESMLVSGSAAVRVLAVGRGHEDARPTLGSPGRFSSNKAANSKAINEALHAFEHSWREGSGAAPLSTLASLAKESAYEGS